MLIMGLMSGTSLDGIDCALVSINGRPPRLSVQLEAFTSLPYTPAQRAQLAALCLPDTGTVPLVNILNFEIGDWLAAAARAALEVAGVQAGALDLIASHGQTIHHAVEAGNNRPATLQIGDPSVIAHHTGVTAVGNFRTADVAAGGQGAPLGCYADWLLWRHPRETRVILNIGGIANVTYLPADAAATDVMAYDTGPGNLLIDAFARRISGGTETCDRNGTRAARGRIDRDWLATLLADPFFRAPPPKTTGRERYGPVQGRQLWQTAEDRRLAPDDRLATVTALTAHSIAHSMQTHLPALPDRVMVGGGGAHNRTLMQMLQSVLDPIPVLPLSTRTIGGDAREAVAFAVLGHETLHGRPGNLPGCTGARQATVLGQIAPGRNFRSLMDRILHAPA